MKHTVSLFIVLALLWWILSGYTKVLLVSLGLVSIVFTLFVSHRMDVVDDESHPTHISMQLLRYWLYLLQQIVISNIDMLKIILSPNPDIDPRIVRVSIRQQSDLGKAVLGNSITLTPGTVTLDFNNHQDEIEVHAINKATADDVVAGTMDKRVPTQIEDIRS
jgi:multicomponent Na+:H+ antiporter subunit E